MNANKEVMGEAYWNYTFYAIILREFPNWLATSQEETA